ncbi:hypothetical protein C0995_013699 [Termitomyces sp. Mi166|nr:hypothetical protein C0995_013699 [Termitomyces sp. Mi166\
MDEGAPLNYDREYQIVFIEPSDSTHVFGIQLDSPFTNATGHLPAPKAHWLNALNHALNITYSSRLPSPPNPDITLPFNIQVDWDQRTLYSTLKTGNIWFQLRKSLYRI